MHCRTLYFCVQVFRDEELSCHTEDLYVATTVCRACLLGEKKKKKKKLFLNLTLFFFFFLKIKRPKLQKVSLYALIKREHGTNAHQATAQPTTAT